MVWSNFQKKQISKKIGYPLIFLYVIIGFGLIILAINVNKSEKILMSFFVFIYWIITFPLWLMFDCK